MISTLPLSLLWRALLSHNFSHLTDLQKQGQHWSAGILQTYIALMNVDVKILTKMLSMRLVPVLPKTIHKSQTSVFGRAIGDEETERKFKTIFLICQLLGCVINKNAGNNPKHHVCKIAQHRTPFEKALSLNNSVPVM